MANASLLLQMHSGLWAIDARRYAAMVNAIRLGGSPATVQERRPPVTRSKILVLPLAGLILQRGGPLLDFFGGTSTDEFGMELAAAVADPSVSAIVIDVDSGGGTVSGVQMLSDQIFAARQHKPIYAVANSLCASAALWIASAATKLYAAPGSETGSVGVFASHVDASGAYEQLGLNPTMIVSSGAPYKVEWTDTAPLSDAARKYEQSTVNAIHADFINALARNRGLSRDVVQSRFGMGRTLSARDALAAGMIDGIATLTEVIALAANAPRERVAREQHARQALAAHESIQSRRLRDRMRSRGILSGTPGERWYGPRYAVVWNRLTEAKVDLKYARMREAVAPGAFAETLNSDAEVYLTIGHDHDNPLARRSDFSLHLSEDDVGLRVEFTLADSPAGRQAAAQLAAGKLQGMSWTPGSMQHEYCDVRGTYCARLTRGDLLEICLTDQPAYAATIR